MPSRVLAVDDDPTVCELIAASHLAEEKFDAVFPRRTHTAPAGPSWEPMGVYFLAVERPKWKLWLTMRGYESH